MSNCVAVSIIASLEGIRGSNPKIEGFFPKIKSMDDDLLKVSLPFGTNPGEFSLGLWDNNKILSYVFEIIRENDRNDLASISFSLVKNSIPEALKDVIQELITRLESHGLLKIDILNANLSKIVKGLNNESKIKIDQMVFDVGYYIRTKKLKLKIERKVRGGIC